MRILLANKFYYHRGGAERTFLDHERWLKEDAHDVAIFSQATKEQLRCDSPSSLVSAAVFDDGWSGLRHVARPFWSRDVANATTALVRDFRPDVALLHNVYHHLGPALAVTLARLQVPMVMFLHDYKLVCPAYSGMRGGRLCSLCAGGNYFYAALNGCGGSTTKGAALAAEAYMSTQWFRIPSLVHSFLAPSEYLRAHVREMGFKRPVQLLRNAVQTSAWSGVPSGARSRVGFAGRLSPEKGVDLLLSAASALPHIIFRVAGAGPLEKSLHAQIQRQRIGNVQLLGRLSQEALRREMQTWRLSVVPSLFAENCPYAVLDPMALGVPVVAADAGGVPELLEGRGFLFRRASTRSLIATLKHAHGADERELDATADRARQFVREHCSPSLHMHSLVAQLKRAAGRGRV